jgi:6,7-dimethyl-8-ribityllumazine synthase
MTELSLPTVEGSLTAPEGARFAIVASRFNELVVDRLVEGALSGLVRHGARRELVTLVRVPGAFELAPVCARLAAGGKVDAVIALGAVIRGATAHFDYVAGQAASQLASVGVASRVPVVFGVLTTDTIEQALERAGTKAGNKGFDAAQTALEMLNLGRALDAQGL